VTLEIATVNGWPIDIAVDNLSLGNSYLLQMKKGGTDKSAKAAEFLNRALSGLRQARAIDYLPLGLLARAALHRLTADFDGAQRDLSETKQIAERGSMELYLADFHLESARLNLAQNDPIMTREHWLAAGTMIERMKYHRRDNEANEIEEYLLFSDGK
jgi:hypothetical protein